MLWIKNVLGIVHAGQGGFWHIYRL